MIQRQQEDEDEGSFSESSLMSPQKSQKKLVSPQFSFSSPTPKKEQARLPLRPKSAGGEIKSSLKAAMKLLVSPVKKVKKASGMLSGSFHNLTSPRGVYCDEDEEENDNDNDMMLLCRELELLSD